MAGQPTAQVRTRPVIDDVAVIGVIGELEPEWDVVSQASWESFPATSICERGIDAHEGQYRLSFRSLPGRLLIS